MLNIIIFGPPGAGKGTQSLKIAEKYGLKHLSTGDIFRKAIKNQTEIGKKVKAIIDKGQLVPDEMVVKVIIHELEKHNEFSGFIFDGFPRTIKQAEEFGVIMEQKGMPVNLVIRLKVPNEELLKRLMKRAKEDGRSDDNEEVIKKRLKIYRNETEPVIDFYDKKGKLVNIDGFGSVEEVFQRVCNKIEEHKE